MRAPILIALGCLMLAACSSPAAPAASAPSANSAAAKPSSAETKPEKPRLSVAFAASEASSLPAYMAMDLGYFARYGIQVDASIVSASAAAQALTSGSVDMYQGGTTPITADLAGADLIYIAATVDKSTLALIGTPGVTTFEALRGKTVATTSPGAFGEVAMKLTAKKYGMDISKDMKLLYHPHSTASMTTFLSGQADAIIAPSPYRTAVLNKGYPLIVDYFKEGLRLPGPALAGSRVFFNKNPRAIQAYLMGYLDGLKRAIDDQPLAKQALAKHAQISDQAALDSDYQGALEIWNRDLRVNEASIKNVLEGLGTPQALAADPRKFYDNSIAEAVTRDYAAKLFPNEVKL